MMQLISPPDLRYDTLKRGFNQRWPAAHLDANVIAVCLTEEDVVEALKYALKNGLRPTVRSGGHCYEGFVSNNEGGIIIDVGLMSAVSHDDVRGFKMGTGLQNWDSVLYLYKAHNVSLPGGSCYSVGLGGHISGGGFGWLSRSQKLTVDWLTGVDIVTVDKVGLVTKSYVDIKSNPKLLRVCRGAGDGNFGIITNYYFKELPTAPSKVIYSSLAFKWSEMTPEKFEDLLTIFGKYWTTEGHKPETFGMFSVLKPPHISGGQITLRTQFSNTDGSIDDPKILEDYINLFAHLNPTVQTVHPAYEGTPVIQSKGRATPRLDKLPGTTQIFEWLTLTQNLNGSGPSQRGKYKSAYMKKNFTAHEIAAMYKHLTADPRNPKLGQSLFQIDSYGGAVNDPARIADTAVSQRASGMKLQYQTYWTDIADDAFHIKWIQDFFTDVYSGPNVPKAFTGTPYPNEYYEGCYINYPDVDMRRHAFWSELYYPGIYQDLQKTKEAVDPENVFHHAMSIERR